MFEQNDASQVQVQSALSLIPVYHFALSPGLTGRLPARLSSPSTPRIHDLFVGFPVKAKFKASR